MASNINALIAQGITPPNPEFAVQGALAGSQLRAAAQQRQLGAQTLQMNALDLQEKQQQINDQQTIQQEMKNTWLPNSQPPATAAPAAQATQDNADDPGAPQSPLQAGPPQPGASAPLVMRSGGAVGTAPDMNAMLARLRGNIRPAAYQALQTGMLGIQEKLDAHAKVQSEVQAAQEKSKGIENDLLSTLGTNLQKGGYDPTALDAGLTMVEQADPNAAPHIAQVRALLAQSPGNIKPIVDGLARAGSPEARNAQTNAGELSVKQAAEARAADEAAAKKPGIASENQTKAADAGMAQIKLGMMQGTDPAKYDSLIDQTVAPKNAALAFRTKAQVRFYLGKGDVAGADAAVKSAAEQVGEVERTMDIKRQSVPIEQAQENYRNALSQGDTSSAKYYDSLTTAKQATATAETIQKVIDLSRSGNAVAASQLKAMIPEFTNAVQNIKRMGGTQAAQMGSTFDKAMSEASGLMPNGTGLSAGTIAALEPYIKTVANGAVGQHNANVDALGTAYPQKKFKPEPLPYKTQTAPAAGTVQQGFRFKGGDASNKANWEPVK